MSFKDILSKLDQLSEATEKTKTGLKHTAEPGGYGRKDDEDEEGNKVKADAPKRGRGRPKKDADSSGEVKKYDFSAFGVKHGKDVKLPKHDKDKTTKHSLKEYFDRIDEMMNQQPVPVLDQGNKQAGVGVVTSKNPAVEKMLSQLSPQDLQVVMKGQLGQQQQQPSATSGGATNQPAMAEEGDYSAKDARAGKDIGKPGKNFAKIAKSSGGGEKGKRIAGAVLAKLRGLKEGDLPPQDGLLGAGLGAGRDQGVTEGAKPDFIDLDKDGDKKESMKKAAQDKKAKKKVDESMDNKLKAAHHAGKSHALSKQGYNCHYDDMEEARMYHEGFKEGLDECYGQVPIRGLTVADEGAQGTVDDMASFGAHTPAMEDEMEEGNAFTAALAKTPKGGKFSVGGKSFTDHSNYNSKVDEVSMFESWDNQLGSLLEEYKEIQEGLSVSVSKGQQGSPDSVSVTAQDGDADKLLALVKSAGLGLFGDEQQQADIGVQAGDAQHGGVDVVGDHDGMMALIKKATGGAQPGTLEPAGSEDYADEEGHEDGGELDIIKQLTQAIGGGSEEGHKEVDEEGGHMGGPADETGEEYMNQEEYEVAEDNAPDTGAEEFAEIDAETAEDNEAASSHGGAQNSNLEEEEDMCETCNESPCTCDHADEEEDLEESYANSDDDGFEADIEFMTKMISGGLNKQKSTGQTTIPVIAGQNDREGYSVQESITDWKKLAGLK